MKAYLLLANGMVFEGRAFGAAGTSVGEVVFNTGMVGYEESSPTPAITARSSHSPIRWWGTTA